MSHAPVYPMQSWQLTISALGRGTLFPDEATQRRAVRALVRVVGAHASLFCIVDDHVHVVVLCARQEAGRLAQRLALALRPLAGAMLGPAHISAVDGRSHLESLVRYLLRQPHKHDLATHPALYTGSCFADLVGGRALPGLSLRLPEALPRFRLRTAHGHVGLDATPLVPLDDAALQELGVRRLVDAASAALAVGPALVGNSAPVVAARVTAAHLAHAAGLPASHLAQALDITPPSARRLAQRTPPPGAVLAARRRLALEDRVAALATPLPRSELAG